MRGKKAIIVFFALVVIAASVWHVSVTQAAIVKGGLISYWPLDAATVGELVVEDVWGDNEVRRQDAEIVKGKVAEGLHFGSNDMLRIIHHQEVVLARGFSVDAWVKGDTAPSDLGNKTQWFAKGDSYRLIWDSPPVRGEDANPSVVIRMAGEWHIVAHIEAPLKAETWYHIAGTWSGRSLKIYLNGQLSHARNWSGSCKFNVSPLTIGGPGFEGALDEVKLYNRALTDEEVMRNFKDWSQKVAVNADGKLPILWGELKRR